MHCHRCSLWPCSHALHTVRHKDTSWENIQTGMHNKGKSSWAPQLISCMEIIFKTEQNGGPSLSGRAGLCRAPGARWQVTVYACLLNKRCWPRWKSAIGLLICPTSVIGSRPNTQQCCDLEWTWSCRMLRLNVANLNPQVCRGKFSFRRCLKISCLCCSCSLCCSHQLLCT